MYYIIVFENLRFRPSSRKRVARVFFTLIVFSEYMWAVGQTNEKIAVFKQNRICVDLATIQVARQLFGNFCDFQQLFRILATFRIFGNFGLFEVL